MEMLAVTSLVGASVKARRLSSSVRERIFAKIEQEKSQPRGRQPTKGGFFGRLAALPRQQGSGLALGLTIAAVLMVGAFSLYVASLMRTMDQQAIQITELKNDLTRNEELLGVLQARRVDIVIMNGLEVNPEGFGKIIWDSERKVALLQISNLPIVPRDKDYQLWIIKEEKPVSAGVFAVRTKKDNFFRIDPLVETDPGHIKAFAVTMEPRGGVAQPTGEMYLRGSPEPH